MLRLDLCCGPRKPEGYHGIDVIAFPGVDVVFDLNMGIPLADNSCDEVRAHDAVEHLQDGFAIMREIWRVLKDGGLIDILVPSTDSRGAWQDFTHKSFWNENTFKYFINKEPWMDYYRGIYLFDLIELYTTPLSKDMVQHVVFKGRAVKNSEWIYNARERWKRSLESS